MSSAFPPSSRTPQAAALSAAGLPRRVREALAAVHGLVHELVIDPFDRLIPEFAARLAHESHHPSASFTAAGALRDELQILQRRQPTITARFAQLLDEEFARLRQPQRESAPPGEPAPLAVRFSDLRLVDDEEADEDTEVRAIAMRVESRAALPLQLLCQRFAVLGASPAFDPGRLPVGPRRLCELMLAAAAEAGLGLHLRVALLREFDRRVLAQYTGIAEALNAELAALRVMPGLSYVPLRPRPRAAVAGDGRPEVAERDRPVTGWTPQGAAEGDSLTFQLLQELLASRRAITDRFRSVDQPSAPPRDELPTSDVVQLLADADPAAQTDFELLRQWLLLRARQQLGRPVALSTRDADSFELLGLLYAQLAREVRGEGALGLLEQLRLPVLKLALLDPVFFVRSTHPAREVLNAVAETGAIWQPPDAVDPQLVLHLQRVVAELARPTTDLGEAFRGAARSLEAQFQGLARRSEISERRHVEAARGKEKLAVARRRASAAIEDALRDVRLPLFHRTMLRHAWADVLTLAHLRHGEDSADWQGLLEATGELVRAAADGSAVPEGLEAQVEQWLLTVGYHADDAARISRLLTAGAAGDDDDDAASRTELTMRLKSRARLGEDALPDDADLPPRTEAEQAQYERLRLLPFGTWLEFREPDGSLSRRRLSWLSPVTGTVLFVNQRGQRVGESSLDALARRVAAGTARVVTAADGRLVDRAWRAALQSLRGLVRTPEDTGRTAGGSAA